MTGYVIAMAPCLSCGHVFEFNPHKVPSHRWPTPDGPRQPICESCMVRVNERRKSMGLPPFEILPGAYEGLPEAEL